MAMSLVYILIILCLIIIRNYQKKYIKQQEEKVHIHNEFKGVDITKLQQNYDILNKILDSIEVGKKEYDKKVS